MPCSNYPDSADEQLDNVKTELTKLNIKYQWIVRQLCEIMSDYDEAYENRESYYFVPSKEV